MLRTKKIQIIKVKRSDSKKRKLNKVPQNLKNTVNEGPELQSSA